MLHLVKMELAQIYKAMDVSTRISKMDYKDVSEVVLKLYELESPEVASILDKVLFEKENTRPPGQEFKPEKFTLPQSGQALEPRFEASRGRVKVSRPRLDNKIRELQNQRVLLKYTF